jgi:hypothetical protein
MLYKALAADRKSSHGWGHDFGPWETDTWYEVEGPLWWNPRGILTPNRPVNGFFCSDDILWCQYPYQVAYIAAVEVDGASIIYDKTQCWQKMRVISIKAWPPSKSALVLDWAEGQVHTAWAYDWPSEAGLYDTRHYQGNFAAMLSIIEPLWRSLFTNSESIPAHSLHRFKDVHKLKSEFADWQEQALSMAYLLALALTSTVTLANASRWVQIAEDIHQGSWATIRGFTEDHWNSLEEL